MSDSEHGNTEKEPIFRPGNATWFKVLTVVWFILALAGAVYVMIETKSKIATLFGFALLLLPLVLVARITRQGKWARPE